MVILQERTLCAMLFATPIAHKVRSYRAFGSCDAFR